MGQNTYDKRDKLSGREEHKHWVLYVAALLQTNKHCI